MLSVFHLVLTDVGLFYVHKLRYGNIKYFVSNDFDDIFEFLGLPYSPDNSFESLFYAITNSDYFHTASYTKYDKGTDKFNEFVKYMLSKEPISLYRPTYVANWGAIKADVFFGTNLLQKILALGPNLGLTNKAIKNKFNGHLVKKWSGMTNGPVLAETIDDFKEYVRTKWGYGFLDYLNSRSPRIVKYEFCVFYFEEPFVDDTPF